MTARSAPSIPQQINAAILPKTTLAPLAPAMTSASSISKDAAVQDEASLAKPFPPNANTNTVIAPRPPVSQPSILATSDNASKYSTVWYLGGNHIIKLLTSVDGDLDPLVLAKLASVPSVVGELALSVESLVSDDATVGGFEDDLLARIASNTLTGKRGSLAAAAEAVAPPEPPQLVSRSSSTNSNTSLASANSSDLQLHQPSFENGNQPVAAPPVIGHVPNPLLADYQPVPNPLARITPPTSPNVNGKRKDAEVIICPETKRMRTATELAMIQAR